MGSNGNGQVKARNARLGGVTGKGFGAPDGPDPAESARKATISREARLEKQRGLTRQAIVMNAPKAVQTILAAIREGNRKGEADWYVRTQNARWLVEQAVGMAAQTLDVTSRDEFTRRVDELLAEMDAESSAAAEATA
jgi:urease gamma subunit